MDWLLWTGLGFILIPLIFGIIVALVVIGAYLAEKDNDDREE